MGAKNADQPTILLVDDTPENLKMLNASLKDAGFRISIAESGEEALQRIEHVIPDLILLDVMMPGLDGFETCRRFKQRAAIQDIPVIFLTALSETVDKVRGFEVGGVDYITKPVQQEEVLARINTHLTIRRLQQQLHAQNDRLEEQNQHFRTLSDATFEGILIHDQGRVIDLNRTMERISGYQRAEVLGKQVVEFVTPASRQVIVEQLQTQDDLPIQAEGLRRDGSSFPMEIQARTMPYQGRDVRIVAIRDLTRQKALEAEKAQLERENIALRSTIRDRYRFGDIIGKSPAMQAVYQAIVKAAATEANVLICGESGTGKELVARTIHQQSERRKQNFVAVNCSAVPDTLFEREFFGHRKGTFTGANRDKPGYFDQAHGGTLFLDEVGELQPSLQVKLLRVLEDKEYIPVGDTIGKIADVRIIAATNKNLREELHKKTIREDFFYRIRVIVIDLPPLQERKEDITLLIDYFLEHYDQKGTCFPLPGHLYEALCQYDWPGNVRELQNELQRYLAEQRFEFIGNTSPESTQHHWAESLELNPEGVTLRETVEAVEKHLIARVLTQNAGHQGKTAKMLGISPRSLYERIRKYRLNA